MTDNAAVPESKVAEVAYTAAEYAAVRDARSRDLEQRRQLLQMSRDLVSHHIEWEVVRHGESDVFSAKNISLTEHRKQIANTYRFFMRTMLGADQS